MQPSLQALLFGIIDYAGLFPPAKLPLNEAIRNYARYRQEPDAWMLGRFICPAARLSELAAFENLFTEKPPFLFSALGRGGNTTPEFLTGLKADLEAIAQFHQRHEGKATVDVIEMKLPRDVQGPNETAIQLLFTQARELYEQLGPAKLTPYYEAALGGDWRKTLDLVLRTLATINGEQQPRSAQAGFKLRCGGLEAAAFPTVEQVSAVITACHEHGVPLKCTAGLHHPLRRYDASVKTQMHGFLNVFATAVFADCRPWCEELGQMLLSETESQSFHFNAQVMRWRDLRVDLASIRSARQHAAISFGSCSFDEPRDDLRALGWMV